MRNKNYRSKSTLKNSNKRMVVLAVLLLGLLGIVTVLELSHTTHYFRPAKTTQLIPVTTNKTSNPVVTNTPAVGKSADTPSTTTTTGSQSQTDGSIMLIKPYGLFVSTHKPTPSGQVLSTCSTSPSTNCSIEFIMGSETKKLPGQITGGDGTTSWLWSIKQAGLSAGSWQIKVTATLNGQTLSTVDQTNLEVQP